MSRLALIYLSKCFKVQIFLIILVIILTTWKVLTSFPFWVDTSYCELDASVNKIVIKTNKVAKCNYGFPALTALLEDILVKKQLNYPHPQDIDCCYGSLFHNDSFSGELHRNDTCLPLTGPEQMKDEYFYVECTMEKQIVAVEPYFLLSKHHFDDKTTTTNVNWKTPNVIVLILGQISRDAFHELLPKTKHHFEKLENIYEFFNLQGDVQSYINLQHLVHGYNQETNAIWFDYKRSGYVTAYGDDCININAKLTPYDVLSDRFYPFDFNWESFYVLARSYAGNQDAGRAYPRCLGSQPTYQRMLNYIKQYLNVRNADNPRALFGVFYIDAFRYDRGNLRYADRHFLNFFREISPHLDKDTVMIFLSDNVVVERAWVGLDPGNRREPVLLLDEEYYVKSAPFFYFLLPISYKIEYPEASQVLEWNSMKMVTYADVHATLRDLIKDNRKNGPTGYSLLKHIPRQSCKTAGIDPNWCLCNQDQ